MALQGDYCHACGQRRFLLDDLSATRLFARFTNELAHLDFKSLHSLAALVRPGYLTSEYLAGRRRRYLSPLKIYFLGATVFFFAAPYVGFSLEDMTANDPSGGLKTIVDARRAERGLEPGLFAERFDLRIQTVYTVSLSISVIAAALLLRLLYRKHTRLLAPHVVFALHYVSFLYLAAIVLGGLSEWLNWHDPRVTLPITYALLGPFLTLALRRVYQESWPRTVVKCLALLIEGNIVDSLVGLAALYLTLLLV
jgi:hypothetical protein